PSSAAARIGLMVSGATPVWTGLLPVYRNCVADASVVATVGSTGVAAAAALIVSSVKERSETADEFPARSLARRRTVCGPSVVRVVAKGKLPAASSGTGPKSPVSTAACREAAPEPTSATRPVTAGLARVTAPGAGLLSVTVGGRVSSVKGTSVRP